MATLKAMFGHSTPDRIKFDLIFSATHAERLACVNDAIDWVVQEHTKTRQHRQERGEDALTIDIVTDLKAMGFDASHDTQYGGHCDIVIESKDNFLWLGEAKVHSGYDWLLKGFQQLDTRYSTGLPGQDHGGMIIYFFGQDLLGVMNKWEEYLVAKRPDVAVTACNKSPLIRNSVHAHERTGLPFHVRHTPINLYFKPND
ncbi:hypothetical protein AB7828_10105 [Tardiphaga sp. 215_C5_N2_1]|uniref:hypothetical protein n=1 Tax=Tardiphaga sp. 215_C5_N2_1 TaxID=3240774 RepID=UPI003F896EC7